MLRHQLEERVCKLMKININTCRRTLKNVASSFGLLPVTLISYDMYTSVSGVDKLNTVSTNFCITCK